MAKPISNYTPHNDAKEWARNWFETNSNIVSEEKYWIFDFYREDLEFLISNSGKNADYIRFYVGKSDTEEIFLLAIGARQTHIIENGRPVRKIVDLHDKDGIFRSHPSESSCNKVFSIATNLDETTEYLLKELREKYFGDSIELTDTYKNNLSAFLENLFLKRIKSEIPQKLAQEWITGFENGGKKLEVKTEDQPTDPQKAIAWAFSKDDLQRIVDDSSYSYMRLYLATKKTHSYANVRQPSVWEEDNVTLILTGVTRDGCDDAQSILASFNVHPLGGPYFEFASPCPTACDDDNSPINPS